MVPRPLLLMVPVLLRVPSLLLMVPALLMMPRLSKAPVLIKSIFPTDIFRVVPSGIVKSVLITTLLISMVQVLGSLHIPPITLHVFSSKIPELTGISGVSGIPGPPVT